MADESERLTASIALLAHVSATATEALIALKVGAVTQERLDDLKAKLIPLLHAAEAVVGLLSAKRG